MQGIPLALKVLAVNLAGALWLQFISAVEEDKKYKQCDRCGLWFYVRKKASIDGTRYCSDSCRVLAARARKGEAIRLSMDGKSPAEVARAVNTSAAMVRKWVAAAKKKPLKSGRRAKPKGMRAKSKGRSARR